MLHKKYVKESSKTVWPAYAVVTSDNVGSTIGDVQETGEKQPYFLCNIGVNLKIDL